MHNDIVLKGDDFVYEIRGECDSASPGISRLAEGLRAGIALNAGTVHR